MKFNLKFLFAITAIFLTISLKGQFNFRKGQIITQTNDTIFGKIYDGGSLMGRKICLFKSDEDKKIKKYYPSELKSYKIDGDKQFSSKELIYKGSLKYFFTEVLLDGKYRLYYALNNKNTTYYLEKDSNIIVPLSNMDIPVRRYSDFAYTAYNSLNNLTIPIYKDTLIQLFADDNKTAYQIINLEYEHKDLINFTKMQIEKTCEGKDCIRYQKDVKKYRDRFGFYYGFGFNLMAYETPSNDGTAQKISSTLSPSIHHSNPIGFFYNIPITTLGDRLSFQAEVATSLLESGSNSSKSRIFTLPFSIRYIFPGKIVSPTIAFGHQTTLLFDESYNFAKLSKTQRESLFLDLALDYKITKGISLFNTFRFQSFSNLTYVRDTKLSYVDALRNNEYGFKYQTYVVSLLVGVKF